MFLKNVISVIFDRKNTKKIFYFLSFRDELFAFNEKFYKNETKLDFDCKMNQYFGKKFSNIFGKFS